MGLPVDREHFEDHEYAEFGARLRDNLDALRELLRRPGFGAGPPSVGAELELNLIDHACRPLALNRAVLSETVDRRITLEIDRFNLEINTRPVALAGRPFSALERELEDALGETRRAAATQGGRVATIGILPTLAPSDLSPGVLTDGHRYRALSAGIRRIRRQPFHIDIEGDERLVLDVDDVTLEGANTSFQIHLRVEPDAFARTYNAAQIATAVALAAGANSPTFLGRKLWDETRIALFRQAVDDRARAGEDEWRPSRVSFGHGWVRTGALELFEEIVAMHAPLLPVTSKEDARARVGAGQVPALAELRLHIGTVWRWNRPVYDGTGEGHLRIELRALPAGPTVVDALATSAFLLGLTLGLAPDADMLVGRMTFGHARRNFYQAARRGLDAELLWPTDEVPTPRAVAARELVPALLPVARRGLRAAGVAGEEVDRLLGIVAERVVSGQTGSRWQRLALRSLAPARMLERYVSLSAAGQPVHRWPSASD